MFYVPIKAKHMEQYLRGDSIYSGFTTPVNYRVMSTRVNPYSGELEITGMREQEGAFPVLPGMLFSWIMMGLWNWFTGWLFSLLGGKKENNPFRLQFHYGYALREDAPPGGYPEGGHKASGYGGNDRNGNGYPPQDLDDISKELYGPD